LSRKIYQKYNIYMAKVKYEYDYPENRELRKKLEKGDEPIIAKASGYTLAYINTIFDGKRKMPEVVKEMAKMVIRINESTSKKLAKITQQYTEA